MLVINLMKWVLSLLSGSHFDIDFNGSITGVVLSCYQLIAYILPMDTVAAIILISLSLYAFRLVVSILKALWSVIPIL
uniref:hypothetical protein n=1 Tax=Pseudoruminococcus massiliensis TaxID=2086583 RepID=UPI003FEFECD9